MARGKNKGIPRIIVTAPTSNKTEKNRRKRQRKRANKVSLVKATKMPMSRLNKIGKWPKSKAGADFLRGLLDPFADINLPQIGVPDGLGGMTLKHSNTMSFTVLPINGGIRFVLVPSVSSPIAMIQGNFKNVEYPVQTGDAGLPAGSEIGDITTVGTGDNNIPCIAWPVWAKYYGKLGGGTLSPFALGISDENGGPYGYRSQRITGMGLEWRYTGTSLTNKGTCTSAVLDCYPEEGYLEFDEAAGGYPGGIQNNSSINFVQRAELLQIIDYSQSDLSNIPGFRQQTLKDAEGSGGYSVAVPADDDFKMDPTKTGLWLTGMNTKVSHLNNARYARMYTYGKTVAPTPGVQAAYPIMPWQTLRPIAYSFDGLDDDMPITIRLVQRCEATIATDSAFQQFTSASFAEDPDAICLACTVAKTIPCMVPVTMNGFGDWWRKIMGKINSLGNVVRGMGIPVASQIGGGVGDIAGILGSFAEL